jgi:CoA-disulfide reductase
MAKKIVIIGGVAGGASAAARLRRLDEDAEIVLFERGKYISFANCGLPYYIGDVIKDRDDLLVQTPEKFKARFNIDVRVSSEVTEIDRERKEVRVKDLSCETVYAEKYDKLVLSPGAEPSKPPIKGIDSPCIFTLRSIPDADAINEFIAQQKPKRAVVVGGGYIGLEMAENLRHRGLLVAIVEMMDQVMPTLDKEMASSLHEHLQQQSIALWLSDAVAGFRQDNSKLKIDLKSGMEIACDMVVLAIGVKPEIELAKQAGLKIGSTGGIKVNKNLQTSDPDIFAIGDAIEVEHFVLKKPVLIPLAGPANKQGRMAADNIAGRDVKYRDTQGTAILKVFELTVAMTGATEKELQKTDMDYEKVYIHPANHVGYYPGAQQMHIKVLFSKPEGKLLGAQIVGKDSVDKRIDVFATAIRCGLTVFELQDLELAYAPPYGSGKDPINMAGFAAGNILDSTADIKHFENLDEDDVLLDVRSPAEIERGSVPGAINIPVNQLRGRLDELPKNKTINIYCAVGIRSYIASRILRQKGFDAKSLSGGYSTYLASTSEKLLEGKSAQQLRDEFCTGF